MTEKRCEILRILLSYRPPRVSRREQYEPAARGTFSASSDKYVLVVCQIRQRPSLPKSARKNTPCGAMQFYRELLLGEDKAKMQSIRGVWTRLSTQDYTKSAAKNQVPIILVCLRSLAKCLSFLCFSRQIVKRKKNVYESVVYCDTAL